MRFHNREEAGEQLARRLAQYKGRHPLILGIPRGGVPMAALVADRLQGDLDVMLVHKLRAPDQPELAVGSIDEAGRVYLAPFSADVGLDEHALQLEMRQQLEFLRVRRARYTEARPRALLTGRTVILVDDGLATGSTMIAAVRAARAHNPARIVVAVGVAPPSAIAHLRAEADEVVCLLTPGHFMAVGEFFEEFHEVTDDDVVNILARQPAGVGRAAT